MTQTSRSSAHRSPLSDAIIVVVSRLVDDAQTETREPSHSDLEFQIGRSGLTAGDPKAQGQLVGKAKRVRGTLSWALEHNPSAGEVLVANLVALIRGCGGFRAGSPNYVGADAIRDAVDTFRAEGYELTAEGELRPLLLDNLSGAALTAALEAYVRRAKRGADDAALVTGTGKDLLEATVAHILTERYGSYPQHHNFPTLLGQVFAVLGLPTPQDPVRPGESELAKLDRALYEVGCTINAIRNKQGTGHGRPWLPTITDTEAHSAVELMGIIAERLINVHKAKP